MDEHTAFEQAYKNGYEQGLKDAVKHGRWMSVPSNGIGGTAKCSVCDEAIYGYHTMNYCPNCGAKMNLNK